jgi:hypothetical protein
MPRKVTAAFEVIAIYSKGAVVVDGFQLHLILRTHQSPALVCVCSDLIGV